MIGVRSRQNLLAKRRASAFFLCPVCQHAEAIVVPPHKPSSDSAPSSVDAFGVERLSTDASVWAPVLTYSSAHWQVEVKAASQADAEL
jgi:hypothetical protein